MASFDLWIDGLLKAEGGFAPKDNTLGSVNFGITEAFLRDHGIDLTSDGTIDVQDVKALSTEKAKSIYHKYFWGVLRLDEIVDQRLANLIGHLGVNCGVGTAARFLQNAICSLREERVAVDGAIGPMTLAAANTLGALELVGWVKYWALDTT